MSPSHGQTGVTSPPPAPIGSDDPRTLEAIRQSSLTLASLDRVLTRFLLKLLTALQAPPPQGMLATLPQLIDQLRALPPLQQWRVLPAGGLVSLMLHVSHCVEGMAVGLEQLSRSRWDRASTYVYPLLAVALVMAFRRARLQYWLRGRISAFFLGIAAAQLFWLLDAALSRRRHLVKLTAQAQILLRLWVISEDIYDRANAGTAVTGGTAVSGGSGSGGSGVSSVRNRSYATNLAALAADDVDDLQKSIARTLLECTNLPAAAAIWPHRDFTFRGLKLVLDVATAATHVSYRTARALSPLPGWLVSLVNIPLSAAAVAWYGLQPKLAAERTAAIVHQGDVAFFIALWRLTDTREWTSGGKGCGVSVFTARTAPTSPHLQLSYEPSPPWPAPSCPRMWRCR